MEIPTPEPGLVICYSYLWRDEHKSGQEEGLKHRPSVIVLVVEGSGDEAPLVTVLPITHSAPRDPTAAVEIPSAVKRHLGLDHARSWVVVSEGNEFLWPGYDLRKRPNSDSYEFGILPGRFFEQVLAAFLAYVRAGRAEKTGRD
jgi:hypothetical protein